MTFNGEYADTIHRHVVVWLDEHIGVPGNNETMKNRFRRITYPLHTFIDVQSTIDFIHQQDKNKKTVFLITSGTLGEHIVAQIYNLTCLRQILIFCGNMNHHRKWAEDYIEKILMFDSDEELLIRLTNEIANYLMEEARQYEEQDNIERAAGLLDWATWLYNDVDLLQREICRKVREHVEQQRRQLTIDYRIAHPNQFA